MGRWAQAARRGNAVSRIGWPMYSMGLWGWTPTATLNWNSDSDPTTWNWQAEQDTGSGWISWAIGNEPGNVRTKTPGGLEPGAIAVKARVQPVINGTPGQWTDWVESEV